MMTTDGDHPPEVPAAGEVLVIRPGDVLVIRYEQRVSLATIDEIKERVMAKLPGLADVLVIGMAQQLAVYRPGDAAR